MIMQEADEKSEKRKKLVAKLIEMRYEMQQLKVYQEWIQYSISHQHL